VRVLIHPRTMTADEGLRPRVDQCLDDTLGPVREHLEWVDVYLTDVNGPRGGPDKHCRVVAHVPAGRHVVVSRVGSDPVAAVARAAGRVRRLVRRVLQRRRYRGRPARKPNPTAPAGRSG
jgi:hypothetical protein